MQNIILEQKQQKKEMEDGHHLCTFNFTAKWDDSCYYIPFLNNYQKKNRTMDVPGTVIAEK